MKNRAEKVMYLTDEKQYKKYTNPEYSENYKKVEINTDKETENIELKSKTNF